MMFQPPTPYVYEMVEQTTEQTTVVDVLLGAVWIVAGLVAFALLLGLACAGGLILLRRFRGRDTLTGAGSTATKLGLGPSSRRPG